MLHEIGREPTPEELAEKLQMPLEKVRKVMKIAKEPISLETPIGDEEDSQLGDFIEDKNAILPLESAIQLNLKETTTRVLASLTPREERVLRMRFGIGMNTDHTLEEVGQQFRVTRERIRQIEAKALRKLKHPSRSQEAQELSGSVGMGLREISRPTTLDRRGVVAHRYWQGDPSNGGPIGGRTTVFRNGVVEVVVEGQPTRYHRMDEPPQRSGFWMLQQLRK